MLGLARSVAALVASATLAAGLLAAAGAGDPATYLLAVPAVYYAYTLLDGRMRAYANLRAADAVMLTAAALGAALKAYGAIGGWPAW